MGLVILGERPVHPISYCIPECRANVQCASKTLLSSEITIREEVSFQENIWKTQFERIAQFEGKLIPELWMQIRYCSIQRNIMKILSFTIIQKKVLAIIDIDCFWNQGFFRICNWILSPQFFKGPFRRLMELFWSHLKTSALNAVNMFSNIFLGLQSQSRSWENLYEKHSHGAWILLLDFASPWRNSLKKDPRPLQKKGVTPQFVNWV